MLAQDQREANYKRFKKIREEKGTKKMRRMTAIEAAWPLSSVAGAFESFACQIMVKFPPNSRIYKHAKSPFTAVAVKACQRIKLEEGRAELLIFESESEGEEYRQELDIASYPVTCQRAVYFEL
ncbi:unnamed protein product [Symbiodinium sp. CCMP2592]|nr:unnamed protein product [Symbiodinium sp. CCMP2592]